MTNLLQQAIHCNDGDRAAKIIQHALGIESDDVANYCFPQTWPADREQRAHKCQCCEIWRSIVDHRLARCARPAPSPSPRPPPPRRRRPPNRSGQKEFGKKKSAAARPKARAGSAAARRSADVASTWPGAPARRYRITPASANHHPCECRAPESSEAPTEILPAIALPINHRRRHAGAPHIFQRALRIRRTSVSPWEPSFVLLGGSST